ILTTKPSPRRSMASTRRRSSIDAARGEAATLSSLRPLNGSIGLITGGCSSPSATSRRLKPRHATMPCQDNRPWQRDSNQTASEEPGAVHFTEPASFPEASLLLLCQEDGEIQCPRFTGDMVIRIERRQVLRASTAFTS